jgi:hypothetical protein
MVELVSYSFWIIVMASDPHAHTCPEHDNNTLPHGGLGTFVAMNVGESELYENFSEYQDR